MRTGSDVIRHPAEQALLEMGRGDVDSFGRHPGLHGVQDTAAGGRLAEVGEIGAGGTVRLGGEVGDQHFTMHVVPQA